MTLIIKHCNSCLMPETTRLPLSAHGRGGGTIRGGGGSSSQAAHQQDQGGTMGVRGGGDAMGPGAREHVCMHVCLCTCVHEHKYACTHHIHTYIHTCMHAQTYIHTSLHPYIYTYIHTCIHTYIPTYLHTYMHAYIHTYIHTYMHSCDHSFLHRFSRIFRTTFGQGLNHKTASPVHSFGPLKGPNRLPMGFMVQWYCGLARRQTHSQIDPSVITLRWDRHFDHLGMSAFIHIYT